MINLYDAYGREVIRELCNTDAGKNNLIRAIKKKTKRIINNLEYLRNKNILSEMLEELCIISDEIANADEQVISIWSAFQVCAGVESLEEESLMEDRNFISKNILEKIIKLLDERFGDK